MMTIIRWEDPPATHQSYDWEAIGAELHAHLGSWALVATSTSSTTAGQMASHIRNGRYGPLRELGRFEATSRTVEGEHRVYARYLGAS